MHAVCHHLPYRDFVYFTKINILFLCQQAPRWHRDAAPETPPS